MIATTRSKVDDPTNSISNYESSMSLPLSTPIKKPSDSKKFSTYSVSDQILMPEKSILTPLMILFMDSISNPESSMSLPLSTPIKKPSDSKKFSTYSVSDQILTPEKSIQTPLTRSRTRSVALSLKEVKKVAIGLQKNLEKTDFVSRLEDEKVDDLVSGGSLKKSRSKEKVKSNEKYEELANFFNSMENSIRLLKLKSQAPTFPNISASIQNLTERRFTHKHLAQLKYILPEAIVIKKVMLHDPVTSCMVPDLHVSLDVDAIDDYSKVKGDTRHSLLRRVFRDRLIDFSKRHPEGNDIPEEELPFPFNQTKSSTVVPNKSYTSSTMPRIVSTSTSQPEFSLFSHKPPRPFKSSFCRKVPILEDQKTSLACLDNNALSTESLRAPIVAKHTPSPSSKSIPFISLITPSSPSTLSTNEEENKIMATHNCESKIESKLLNRTPTKGLLTPSTLMSNTPESRTLKRKRDSIDCDTTRQKSARTSTRTRLFFTPEKNDTEVDKHNAANSSSGKHDILDFLPDSLLQSIREKERKLKEDKATGVDEAKRRAKMIACLPRTFDMILLMFQRSNRLVLTKEELVHKIIANNCKIVDRDEVEEQLKLLRELVPDWLSERSSSAFGILYSTNKPSSAEEVRQRLASAK